MLNQLNELLVEGTFALVRVAVGKFVAQRVRLNDVGETNGELQLFVGGKSVINVGGLVLVNSTAGRIRGMQFQTFFGGKISILLR